MCNLKEKMTNCGILGLIIGSTRKLFKSKILLQIILSLLLSPRAWGWLSDPF